MGIAYSENSSRMAVGLGWALLVHLVVFVLMHFFAHFQPAVPDYAGIVYIELSDFDDDTVDAFPAEDSLPGADASAASASNQQTQSPGASSLSNISSANTPAAATEPDYRFQQVVPDASLASDGNPPATSGGQALPGRTGPLDGPTDAEIALRRENLVALQEWLDAQPDLSTNPASQNADSSQSVPGQTDNANNALSADRLAEIDRVLDQFAAPGQQIQAVNVPSSPGDSRQAETLGAVPRLSADRVRISGNDPRLDQTVLSASDPPVLTAMVSFIVDATGKVIDLQLQKSSGNNEIDARIRAAVQTWRFTPVSGAGNARGEITYSIRRVQ